MEPFFLQKGSVWAVPILHYNMEMAAQVHRAFRHLNPDCVAVELAETMQLQMLHAASRLPDISVVLTYDHTLSPLYYLAEPCDPAFEALRSALEAQVPAWCIDLDVSTYPEIHEALPDPYSIQHIGLKNYYEAYDKLVLSKGILKTKADQERELYMAKRLKELSLSYEKILFIGGMSHVSSVLDLLDRPSFPHLHHTVREVVDICTLTEDSCRDVMAEYGWLTTHYEKAREALQTSTDTEDAPFPPDRQKLIYNLLKTAGERYTNNTGNSFPGYHMRNMMKFLRNYSLVRNQLMPNLHQILSTAKGCVDHNYAYEVWELASDYGYHRNVDALLELDLSVDDIWGNSKLIQFHLKMKSSKSLLPQRSKHKERSTMRFAPLIGSSICSFPPEDLIIERFGEFLKKKGVQITSEEGARTIPFSSSIEDGVDTRETIRHWHEGKLYVRARGKPQGGVGSIVMIFDEDTSEDHKRYQQKYPWCITWLGENSQESDMAFYATPMNHNIVGPGICRCEYGGFMMSSPPRRMYDVWHDEDYTQCRSKAEVLLMAAIDYATKPLITYVAAKPPRSAIKSYARRFGKKIVYLPIGQLSPQTLNKLRVFHVLDGQDKRNIAGEYIF